MKKIIKKIGSSSKGIIFNKEEVKILGIYVDDVVEVELKIIKRIK